MPRVYTYKDYVELLNLPSQEPTEQALSSSSSSSSSSELVAGSMEYIILISFVTNIVTLCCLFGFRKCLRYVRHYLKEKYLFWNLSSSSLSVDDIDEGVLFDDIYASEINDRFVSEKPSFGEDPA
jgi:hypothetical protein